MTRRTIVQLHRGLLGGLTIAVLALLATFYSVVAGAVEQAATKRIQAAAPAPAVISAQASVRRAAAPRPFLLAGAAP